MAIDEANARREFFNDDSFTGSSGFFDSRATKACVDHDLILPAACPALARASFAGDVALIRDTSAFAGVTREGDLYTVIVLDEMRPKRGEPLKLSAVIEKWCAILGSYAVRSFVADGFNREPAREFARKAGMSIDDAPEGMKGKELVYLVARKLIGEGRVRLPNHPRLLEQFASVVAKPREGGGLQIQTPRRAGLAHGDLVSAVVLALWLAESSRPDRIRPPSNVGRSSRWYGAEGGGRGF
jgi:hypothetical protein